MTEKDYKKARQNLLILYGFMGVFFLLAVIVFLRFAIKADNPDLSAKALMTRLESAEVLYVKQGDSRYALVPTDALIAAFDDLTATKKSPMDGASWITIHFGELYEFYVYEDGIIEGFDGYARSGTKNTAFYRGDPSVYEIFASSIRSDGKPADHDLGFFK